ncbi:hypothetical protein [Phenylobacterium sp.]|uniref:hypothetical protein n=1 Tax=Phenylobacterium sp. TaxID=1871053 RepID=UPI002DE621ED|nr:hypothetical protein [Phenylobacterium sp.]
MVPIFLAAAMLMGATPAAKAETAKTDPAQRVCWSEPRPGSKLNQRICGTQAERDRRTQEAHDAVNDIRNRGSAPRSAPQ